MDNALNETNTVLTTIFQDKWKEAGEFLSSREETIANSDGKWWYSFLKHWVLFVEHLVVLNSELDVALSHAWTALKIANDHRRKDWISTSSISRIFHTVDYDSYTDEECHAEVSYAELNAVVAITHIINGDRTVNSLRKAVPYLKRAYFSYQESNRILHGKTLWGSESSRANFECGIRLTIGLTDSVISSLPPPLNKILKFFAFPGNRESGIQQIKIAAQYKNAFRWIVIGIATFSYHVFYRHLASLKIKKQSNILMLEKIVRHMKAQYPHSVYEPLLDCLLNLSQGQLDEAFHSLKNLKEDSFKIRKFWITVQYFQMIAFSFQGKFEEAAETISQFEDLLTNMTGMRFLKGSMYVDLMERQPDKSELWREKAVETFKSISQMKKKVVPFHELFFVDISRHFDDRPEEMVLPFYETILLLNVFPVFSLSERVINPLLDKLSQKWRENESNPENSEYYNRRAVILFIKGHCYQHLAQFEEAESAFQSILDMEESISFSKHIAPLSIIELGRISFTHHRDGELAKRYIKSALSYTGYHESMRALVRWRGKTLLHQINRFLARN